MSKTDVVELNGVVVDLLKGAQFKVRLENVKNDPIITAHLSGKMRQNKIKLIEGDSVVVQLSPYDLTRGRIVWRNK